MVHSVPKPTPKAKKTRKPLKAKKWGVSDKPVKPLRMVNPKRKAKRDKNKRKHYASPEYKAARKEAMEHAGSRCEAHHILDSGWRLVNVLLPEEESPRPVLWRVRCPAITNLEFHETHYGSKTGLIRPIKGYILCEDDHQYIEVTRHSHRQRSR